MALIIPGSSVGTVQLVLLNLLQAVVIMADISLLRVTKSREGNFARPPWFILCQAAHCWGDQRAVKAGHWKVSSQSGNSMATLRNAWERTRFVFWRLYQNGPQGQKECSFPDNRKKALKEDKGCCCSLLISPSKLNPPAAPSAAHVVNAPLPPLKCSTSVVCSGLGRSDLETQVIDFF